MGERVLDFGQVTVGNPGPEISHSPTRTDLVVYAGASVANQDGETKIRGEAVAVLP